MSLVPSLPELGLSYRFSRWREQQEEAVYDLLDSDKRFNAVVAPTGFGKSLVYMAYQRVLDVRTASLTHTRTLQTQLRDDFSGATGLVDIRGQQNYICDIARPNPVSWGPCHAGVQCELRQSGCSYYDTVRAAAKAQHVNTNYSWWLANNAYGEKTGDYSLLICDEAHLLPDVLSDFLKVTITDEEVRRFINGYKPPKRGWERWAGDARGHLQAEADNRRAGDRDTATVRRIIQIKDLLRRLARLALADHSRGGWVLDRDVNGWTWTPLWPGPYAEAYLFRNIPKIIFVSATIRPKTLALVGLKPSEYDFREYPSTFPVSRRPVIYLSNTPPLNIRHRTDPMTLRLWQVKHDAIIKARSDRKGIIHSVSYERASFLYSNSRFQHMIIRHLDARGQQDAVRRFKDMRSPAVLLSPSVTTGMDFPYRECEWQIISKVPFPDTRAAIIRARSKEDPEYPFYLAMIALIQACGRGMRAVDDRCETFILDSNFRWFIKRYARFAPSWFLEAIRYSDSIPPPPPRLAA